VDSPVILVENASTEESSEEYSEDSVDQLPEIDTFESESGTV